MSKIILIAAIGKNYELGKNNELIWHIKEDMKFFKEETMNHYIVMGANTFKSLPKLLVGRKHIVLTHQNLNIEGVQVFNNFESLKDYLNSLHEDVYIIGGATIYKLFLPLADELVLTEINALESNADAYFPTFNKENYEQTIINDLKDNDISYKRVRYRRKTN